MALASYDMAVQAVSINSSLPAMGAVEYELHQYYNNRSNEISNVPIKSDLMSNFQGLSSRYYTLSVIHGYREAIDELVVKKDLIDVPSVIASSEKMLLTLLERFAVVYISHDYTIPPPSWLRREFIDVAYKYQSDLALSFLRRIRRCQYTSALSNASAPGKI